MIKIPSIPTVSVVMPAFNAEKYLREAIESILSQTFTDFEFIIVNDGSTDSTKDIILSYNDPRIIYLENEINSGIVVTLNKGLDAARGKYIARMDADDISLPERFAAQVDFLDTHPDIGVVGTYLQIIDEQGNNKYIFENASDPNECFVNMIFATCVGHPTVMLRREILTQNHLRYEEYFKGMEDYYLWWQMSKFTKFSNLKLPLLNYRKHSAQITKNQINEHFLNVQKIFLKQRLNDLGITYTDEDLELLNQYLVDCGDYDNERLLGFTESLCSLYKQLRLKKPEISDILKLYIAKAISLAMDRSKHKLTKTRFFYTNKALVKGCMPFIWWMKRTYHYIIK